MKILIIGSAGRIGSAVAALLGKTHTVIGANRTHGELRVDLTSRASLGALFSHVGMLDAVVCAAGEAQFKPFAELTDEDYAFGIASKLMGQVNVTREARAWLSPRGSITLTGGTLAHEPMRGSASISMINAGLEGFTRAAALELGANGNGLRVNVVSPPWVTETVHALGLSVADTLSAAAVARAYRESVEGSMTGEVLDPHRYA